MLKRFKNSYYSKIMIVCIAAVCAITAILLPVCSSLIHQQERSEDLKKYDLILDRLTASMTSRQEALATNLTPFFSDEANTQNLCSFYRSTSKKIPLEYRDSVMEMLRSFCFSDSYCCGALLLTVTGHLYQDNSLSHTLVPLSLRSLTTKLTPYELQLFTDQQLMTLSNDLQRNVEKAYLYEIAQRKAELYAMQTSINPHFLYNALEQIRVQILKSNSAAASHMLLLLSKMYRNQTRRNLYITIAEECSQSENLINFYMYRYGDFEYEFNIHSSIKIYGIPKNTLQPLIENYFVHGFIPDSDENLLTISAHPVNIQDTLWIEFCVEDNGSSITEEELVLLKEKLAAPVMSRSENNGFALSNVNHRLKLVFGNDSGLVPGVGSDGTGFAVRFRIPAILPEDLQKT